MIDGCCHIIDVAMNVPISYTLVVDDGVIFSMVVSIVRSIWICTFFPIYFETELIFFALYLEVLHVPSFCLFNCDFIVGECLSSGITGFNWSWRLRMAH